MTKWALVTGADAGYFPLLKNLVRSIRASAALDEADLWVLDLGLEPGQADWIAANRARVAPAKWDIDFPGRDLMASHYKAMTARPFLPNYFPDHDIIMWLDADIWVQDPAFALLYHTAAKRYGFAITPEVDRGYPILYGDANPAKLMHHEAYYRCFGRQAADDLIRFPIMNSGAFAIRRDHPVWSEWQRVCRDAIARAPLKHAEQAAFNFAIYSTKDSQNRPHLLPSLANWICSVALPMWDPATKKLVEPNLPHQKLGLIHLAGVRGAVQLRTTDGRTVSTGLAYDDYERLRDGS